MLFRKEAVENSLGRLSGDILLTPKLSQIAITIFILVWVAIAFIWLTNSNYSRKETVLGWLESTEGIARVYNDVTGGTVTEIYVNDGQEINQGDRLFRIDTSKKLTNGNQLEDLLLTEYLNQKLLLTKQLERNQDNFPLQENQLKIQLASAKLERDKLSKQLGILRQQELIVVDEVSKYDALFAKQAITQMEVNRANKELLSIQGEQQVVSRLLEKQKEIINQHEAELQLIPSKLADDSSVINAEIHRLNQQILQVKSQKEKVFYAPISGHISNLQIKKGQKTSTTAPLLSIVPVNANLMINLLVPIRSAGFLAVGQQLSVRYDAFPYQKFGIYSATVTKISSSVFLPEEFINASFSLQEPFYQVEASLNDDSVTAYGKVVPLKSGMTLSADINLSKRSLLEWLLEPIYSLKGQFK